MKCIIYCRKSTDREDKQAISLEYQIENCRRTASRHHLEIVEEIQESKSAKKKGLRPGFKSLIQKCDKGKIDYIIVDELKRLSRNTSDGGDIINLLDEQLIKGIITISKLYDSENDNDTMMLSFEFIFSKKENQDRARDTKVKMSATIKNYGRHLSKAPFGYKNVTISKSEKAIVPDGENAELVKEMFHLRKAGKTLQEISQYTESKIGKKLLVAHVEKILKNKLYCGVVTWNGEQYPGSHTPLITTELYYTVNAQKRVLTSRDKDYLFQKMIKDSRGLFLSPYTKKGKYVYYHNQATSTEKLNMSEKKIMDKIDMDLLSSIVYFSPEVFEHFHEALTRLQTKFDEDQKAERKLFLEQKTETETRKNALVNKFLDNEIDPEIYKTKLEEFNEIIKECDTKLENIQVDNTETHEKVKKLCELTRTAYLSYQTANEEEKISILKSLECELLMKDSETLCVRQKPVVHIAKGLSLILYAISALKKAPEGISETLSNSFGNATENGTPAYGMKTRCPNH